MDHNALQSLLWGPPRTVPLIFGNLHILPTSGLSKLLVSPLITPMVVPYIIPHITPPLRSLDYISYVFSQYHNKTPIYSIFWQLQEENHTMKALARVQTLKRKLWGSVDGPQQRWGFPKIRGTFLGVPIIRTIGFLGLYWGPPILGNYQVEWGLGVAQGTTLCIESGKRTLPTYEALQYNTPCSGAGFGGP